jgi:uncharacterized protein YbgA (DUF1722 family)/uncharacterized protein YbbK (DUF523 family)
MPSSICPRIVVSECLGFKACRYNGEVIEEPFLKALEPYVEFVFVCPEVEIGLGIPRDPIRLVVIDKDLENPNLIQPATGRDVTGEMIRFSSSFLDGLSDVDGFVLKGGSPSCGVKDVKRFPSAESKGGSLKRGPGLFAKSVLDKFPDLPIEDEGRLKNLRLREHYLTRAFAGARLRGLSKSPSMKGLVQFQAANKLLLLAYNQTQMRRLGRIVANPGRKEVAEVLNDYGACFLKALSRLPRLTTNSNVLQHAFGYVSKDLTSEERTFFLSLLTQYRALRIPLSAVQSVLRSWLIRFDVEYLLQQTYFDPFPTGLVTTKDSGKGRKVD